MSGQAFDKNFTDIMKHYRNQPQAASHVYRSVLLKPHQPSTAGEAPTTTASGDTGPRVAEAVDSSMTRTNPAASSSQSQAPSQPPPTPTRMANRSTVGDDGSERGDIICFYNTGVGNFITRILSSGCCHSLSLAVFLSTGSEYCDFFTGSLYFYFSVVVELSLWSAPGFSIPEPNSALSCTYCL